MEINNPEFSIHCITWKELHRADRTMPVPFQIPFTDINTTLVCDEIIRLLPGKRLVAFATWNEKPVVAKLFFQSGKHAKRHIEREVAGVEALVTSRTPTPKILWQGTALKQKVQVLIFERIMDAVSLDILWQEKKNTIEAVRLMQAATIELATQHVLGIEQRDLHLKNFLVTHKTIYTLDGGSIKQHPGILPKELSIDHLALFFAQLGVGTEELQEKLFQTYIKARSWIVKKADVDLLLKATRKWIEKRWERYHSKIQRNSTAFAYKKSITHLVMYDREYKTAAMDLLIKHPDAIFQHPDTQILKAGRSSTVAKIKIDDRYFVIKRYNIKNIWHRLRRCLRTTRAATSWILAQQLCLFGIPTAKPVAFVENRFFGLRGKSYFIMEYIEGPHAGDYFANYRDGNEAMISVAERIVALFVNLTKLRLTHGDTKMTNILIKNDQPYLIDLDGMMEHRSQIGLKMAFKNEMRRFMKNWETMPAVKSLFENILKKIS